MKILDRWKEFFSRDQFLSFIGVVLKGYGQTLFCLNRMMGFFIFLVIFLISPQICLLTIIGASASTLAARVMNVRCAYFHSGCYGFNGVVLGIAWPCFLKINAVSIMMLFFLSWGSSVILKCLMDHSSRTRTNVPVFTVPSLVLVWLMYILVLYVPSLKALQGPEQYITEYIQGFQSNILRLYDKQWTDLTIGIYLETFKVHLMVMLFICIGIYRHSRLSLAVAIVTTAMSVVLVAGIGGLNELGNIDEYLYNTVPCGMALGGIFVVLNRKVWLMIVCNLVFIVYTVYLGKHFTDFPIFVAPFNFFTILSIWLIKKGILTKKSGFYAVPMDLVYSPESAVQWREGEIYAQNFWKDIERSWAIKADDTNVKR